ncbi:hypothetical protein FRC18_006263 [Serendipita sp. 400]|nr:hypothetical protein FRC18_006263 [Serendipita sp. 400]
MQQHIKSPFHAQKSAHCPHCQKKFKTASGVAHHLEHHFGNCRVSNVVRQWDTSGLISTQSYTSYTPTARIEAVSDSESSGSNSKHGSLAPRQKPETPAAAAAAAEAAATNKGIGNDCHGKGLEPSFRGVPLPLSLLRTDLRQS